MHAHTGVMSHLIGPRDRRRIARVRVVGPAQAGNRVERRRGSSGRVERRAGKKSRAGDQRGPGMIVGKEVARTMSIP